MWATLGDIQFQVQEAPSSLRYRERTQYARHERIEGKATLQYTGDELQTLDLGFFFGIGWCNPDDQLQRLQEAREARRPMPLVLGEGKIGGNYVIESVDVNLQQTDKEGRTELIRVTVKLVETIDSPEPDDGVLFGLARPFETRV